MSNRTVTYQFVVCSEDGSTKQPQLSLHPVFFHTCSECNAQLGYNKPTGKHVVIKKQITFPSVSAMRKFLNNQNWPKIAFEIGKEIGRYTTGIDEKH